MDVRIWEKQITDDGLGDEEDGPSRLYVDIYVGVRLFVERFRWTDGDRKGI